MDDVRWVRRGLIMVPDLPAPQEPKIRTKSLDQKSGPKPRETFYDWTPESIRKAHARFFAGDRDVWTREGERLYQRERKRAQRASGRMSAEDRRWATRAAIKGSWLQFERDNRR